jgi:hypothetical protein
VKEKDVSFCEYLRNARSLSEIPGKQKIKDAGIVLIQGCRKSSCRSKKEKLVAPRGIKCDAKTDVVERKSRKTLKVRYSRQTAVVVECEEVVSVGDEVRAVIDRCCMDKVSQCGTTDRIAARHDEHIPLNSRVRETCRSDFAITSSAAVVWAYPSYRRHRDPCVCRKTRTLL